MELPERIYGTDIKSTGNSLTFVRLNKFSTYLQKYLNLCKMNARENAIDLVGLYLLLFIDPRGLILLWFTSGVK